jgi:hypothetical protein
MPNLKCTKHKITYKYKVEKNKRTVEVKFKKMNNFVTILILTFCFLERFSMRIIKQQKNEYPNTKNIKISEMTIGQLKHLIEYVKALELQLQKVKETIEKKKQEDDLKRQRIIKAYLESRAGGTSFMRDFIPDRMFKKMLESIYI